MNSNRLLENEERNKPAVFAEVEGTGTIVGIEDE